MFCNIDALVPMLAYFKICNIQSICVKVNLMDNKLKIFFLFIICWTMTANTPQNLKTSSQIPEKIS
jgi:hypothetical protein